MVMMMDSLDFEQLWPLLAEGQGDWSVTDLFASPMQTELPTQQKFPEGRPDWGRGGEEGKRS